MKTQQKKITLVGAGLVGSLLAVYLAKRGYHITIFEKRSDMRSTAMSAGRSINLALANRGIKPLEEVGLMSAVAQLIIPMTGRMLHDKQGQLTFLPYGQRSHEVIYSVSRGELNKLLMNAAEAVGHVDLHFQHSIETVDFDRNTMQVKNEVTGELREHQFDLLIGADGGGSAVRKAVDAYHGQVSVEEKLFHSYKELHIAATPQHQFQMQGDALHIWPRGDYMMIALPNPDKSFTVTLFLPDQGPDSFSEMKTAAQFLPFAHAQFADALPLMPDAGPFFEQNPTGFLGTVHCPNWTVPGKALLIGDAAHAIVPFHGQGMNCGFEDCAELAALLAQHDDDWAAVMPAYQAARQPNSEAIAQMAQENYVEMRATSADPKFQLKKQIGFLLEQRFSQFIPRYSMVMFHHLPYAEALRRGRLNDIILDALSADIDHADALNWERAEQLVQQHLGA